MKNWLKRLFNWGSKGNEPLALPPPEKKKWSSVEAWDIRSLNGEVLLVIEHKYKTATPHPKLKGPDGLPARFNGSAYNLPTFKSFLLSMTKLGHGMEVEREALEKLMEMSARVPADQLFQIRLLNNEPVGVFRRTAGQLCGKLSEDAAVYIPSPGVTVMNREKLAKYVDELKEAKIDSGLEEVVLKTLNQAAEMLANPELLAKAREEERLKQQADLEAAQKEAAAPRPEHPVAVVEQPKEEAPAAVEQRQASAPAQKPAP